MGFLKRFLQVAVKNTHFETSVLKAYNRMVGQTVTSQSDKYISLSVLLLLLYLNICTL